MRFADFEHVIGAAANVTARSRFVVIGSQAILGTTRSPPESLLVSMEVDIYVPDEPDVTDRIDGALGDGSWFHTTYGFYAHAVGPETAKAPDGWQVRLVPAEVRPRPGSAQAIVVLCLEIHDLVLSKAVAGRQRDWDYARDAFAAGLLSLDLLLERSAALPVDVDRQGAIRGMLRRAAEEAR